MTMSAITDSCMERNRRYAWRRFYQAREDARAMTLWATELAEWLDALVDDLPGVAAQLVSMCQSAATQSDLIAVRQYVRANLPSAA